MTRAAIWFRVSDAGQHAENRLPDIEAWAGRQGLPVEAGVGNRVRVEPGGPAARERPEPTWLTILVRKLLNRGSCASVDHPERKVLGFVNNYNRTRARPFK